MKTKTLKILALVLAMLMILGTLSACGEGTPGPAGAQGEKGEQGIQGDKGEVGNGIVSIEKTLSDGLVDTYTITFTDGSTTTFTVTNGEQGIQGDKGEVGNGIVSIEKTLSDGLVDTYTITFTDGSTTTFTVTNGEQGDRGVQGDNGAQGLSAYETFLKYHPEYTGTEEDWINDVSMGKKCNLFGHEWDEGIITIEPTKGNDGEKTYSCLNCEDHKYEVLPKIEVADAEIYEIGGIKYVNYGSYPQTHVVDLDLIAELNKLTETNDRGYYEYNGNEYAKVTTTPKQYGPVKDSYGETHYYQYSDGSTVNRNVVEWFEVEPIQWRIISENADGSYQLYSEYIIDATSYGNSGYVRNIDDNDIYLNNYKYSNIRAWLNGYNGTDYKITDYTNKGFYDLAFKDNEKAAIVTKEIDNSASTTNYSGNMFACENTYDKIYLFSYQDMYNSNYGFINNISREVKLTDYAKAVGACWSAIEEFLDNGSYWLRSPYTEYIFSSSVSYGAYDGDIDYFDFDASDINGVRVACTINLEGN